MSIRYDRRHCEKLVLINSARILNSLHRVALELAGTDAMKRQLLPKLLRYEASTSLAGAPLTVLFSIVAILLMPICPDNG